MKRFAGLALALALAGFVLTAALAVSRRPRDLLVFPPGLLFRARAERRVAPASAGAPAVTSR